MRNLGIAVTGPRNLLIWAAAGCDLVNGFGFMVRLNEHRIRRCGCDGH